MNGNQYIATTKYQQAMSCRRCGQSLSSNISRVTGMCRTCELGELSEKRKKTTNTPTFCGWGED